MPKIDLKIDDSKKLPQFDLPIDFIVYDNITSSLLNFYGKFPCKIEACIFAFCVKGTVKATINLWQYDIKENDFIVLIPGSFIQIHEVSEDVQISFAGFSSKFLKTVNFWKSMTSILMPIFKNPILSMQPQLAQVYSEALSLLTKASLLPESILTPNLTKGVLNIFVDSLGESLKKNLVSQKNVPSTREQDILAEFLQLAFENYREEHKISFYAHEINLTLSHFCNVISKTTSMTPQEIIMHLIIMDAKTQLKGTDTTVTKISSILGFATPTTFNRYFRTYTGMTPQEYRYN
ncbi:MAG: AraC family transcriptional regulator [Muribaculaceae bacterium]|nr:AraC family transcriptional regulator [Muribaculaceae bacterium]